MTTLRAIGRLAGAVALATALAGCGDDEGGDTTTTGDAAAAEQPGDTGEDAEVATGQDDATTGDDGGSDDASEGSGAGDSGEPGESGDSGEDGDGGSDSAAPGVYRDYSADAVADTSYDTTVLFFWASWCPECLAFENAIQDQGVPDGVQILKTDYDTEQDLKERYGVTHQSWFVKVDSDGAKLSDWLGYGEDKSVETILEQLG